jgi:3-methyladenine DNA glycosylase AlkC
MEIEKFSLKDHLFNPEKIEKLGNEILTVYPDFNALAFQQSVVSEFPKLELKARIGHIAKCLCQYLPEDYPRAIDILLSALPEPCNRHLSDNDYGDFIYASFSHFVAEYGCTPSHLTTSLQALEEITTRFSAEFAIRSFLIHFPVETFQKMLTWASHPHYHVRRLASEGSRPNLPWGIKTNLTTEATLPILEILYTDSTRFVTRSVANHLNDIAKKDANLVLGLLQKWKNSELQNTEEMNFIINHSLRSLVKQGHPPTLHFLGFEANPKIKISQFEITKFVLFDDYLSFSFEIHAQAEAKLLIDYAVIFQNNQGALKSRKVFKIKQFKVNKGESITIEKRQQMRKFMTTRKLYPGIQGFELQINGKTWVSDTFELI